MTGPPPTMIIMTQNYADYSDNEKNKFMEESRDLSRRRNSN